MYNILPIFSDNKDSQRQFGSIYATNYRLIYVDNNNQSKSFTINLENISKTEFYTGFLKSSPKVTIYLKNMVNKDNKNDWICSICSFLNPIDSISCNLCGVVKDTNNSNRQTAQNNSQFDNSCPKCTFKNHPLMTRCELCETTLKPLQSTTPTITPEFIRVSFRGGGEGQFYSTLKLVLEYKAWSIEDPNVSIFNVVTISSNFSRTKYYNAINLQGLVCIFLRLEGNFITGHRRNSSICRYQSAVISIEHC